MADAPRLLSVDAAAEYLALSPWTVRDMVATGVLPSVRLPVPRARDGRPMRRILIDKADVDALIDRSKNTELAVCEPRNRGRRV